MVCLYCLRNGYRSTLSDRTDVYPLFAFVVAARICDADRSALGEQNLYLSEQDDDMLIFLICRAPLKHVLTNWTKESQNGGEEVWPMYHKKNEPRAMTKTFVVAVSLQYNDSREDQYELHSPEAQVELLIPQVSQVRSGDVERNTSVVPNFAEWREGDVPTDDIDWVLKGTVHLGRVEKVRVKWRLLEFWESCRFKRLKVSNTVVEAIELADGLIKQGGRQSAKVPKNFASLSVPSEVYDVIVLSQIKKSP